MFNESYVKYFDGSFRTVNPEETIENYEEKLKIAGITRISDITHLDSVGIPVFSAIRPTAQEGGVSVYSGKGATKIQAKASAMMEGFERYSAEKQNIDNEKIIKEAYQKIENPIELNNLNVPKVDYDIDEVEWVESTEINSGKKYHVPSNSVFHPYSSSSSFKLFRSNTNGLASGNVLEEAVLHGIFEVVERDAWSIFELTRLNNKEVELNDFKNPLIDEMLEKFTNSNIEIKLMDLTADVNIPTIAASSDDKLLKDPALLTLGVGTHLNPEIAVLRALTEVAQSRVTQIHGTREDTTRADFMRKAGYERMKKINRHYFQHDDEKININDIKDKSSKSLKNNIETSIGELKKASLDKVLFVDLTRKEIGVSVVRMIIPGAELYSVDSDRVGKRAFEYENRVNNLN
ncbi:MAG: YcaO-related McrA-glycine thioamidation protein [Methanobrevibacter sp.]|jgi:ribosomal protein S12 methylthiotransferase accessory factor|nr:YcaO-related McrA-glycine thioamidation protein [Candidatus Methanovirga aequatorialis]